MVFLDQKINIHNSWKNLFIEEILNDLTRIVEQIGNNYTPSAHQIFRFLNINLNKCKYVILGQDPYPQPNVATGRAFEVAGITRWEQVGKYASLRNILKLLHKNQTNSLVVQSINKVIQDINNENFKILPPNLLFENWEKQGVLLLNASLTCEVGNTSVSNSHSNYWACFTQEVIDYIVNKFPNIIWLLWGKNAQKVGACINKDKKLCCNHPQLNSSNLGSFFSENHFCKATKINWYGI